jgi:membrane protein required for colicin V production
MTTADLIIVATLAVSGLLAMVRGFTLELLSIIAFVAAALIALLLLPVLKPLVGDVLPQGWAGTLIIVGTCFLVALIPLWYLSDRLGHRVRGSAVGAIDRTFGFAFGAVRGLFILAIAFLAFQAFTGPERNMPDWIRQARLLPLVKGSADLILAILPEDTPLGRNA